MNRYAKKVSDYGLIFRAWSKTERGSLHPNDGKRRLVKKQKAEGWMTERWADRRGTGGAKREQEDEWVWRGSESLKGDWPR